MNLKQLFAGLMASFTLLSPSFTLSAEEAKTVVAQEVSAVQSTQDQLEKQFGKDSPVLTSYQRLMQALTKKVSPQDLDTVAQAVLFAARAHQDKTRKLEKTPYLCYPLDVTYDLVTVAGIYDVQPLVAAILHDTVRDKTNGALLKEVEQTFGPSIADVVKELGRYPISTQQKQQHLLMAHASQESKVVAEVQLANLLYNLQELMNTPPKWTQEKKDHYVEFAQAFVERLHEANPLLTQAVEKQIQAYWDAQNKS